MKTTISVPKWERVGKFGKSSLQITGTLDLICFYQANGFAVTETKDGGPKYAITHIPTGIKIRQYAKLKGAKEFIFQASKTSVDWATLTEYTDLQKYVVDLKLIVDKLYAEGYM